MSSECLRQPRIEVARRELARGHVHGDAWRAHAIIQLREGVEIFSTLSRDHIALEEYPIYPQVLANLDAQARASMDAEMAARRLAHSMRASRRHRTG